MFFMLLGLLFIGLKLASIITWSWWLVLAPLYVWPVLLFTLSVVVAVSDRK